MVENINRIGEALGVVWSFFQNEAGDLTLTACLLLAAATFATAYRCLRPVRAALAEDLWRVSAAGLGVMALFSAVGLFFLYQGIQSL